MYFYQKGNKDRKIFLRCQEVREKNHIIKSRPVFVD